MTRRWVPQIWYTLRRNTASITKDMIWFGLVSGHNHQRWSPRGHILKSLALASKPQVLENCPVLGSRTALFFEPLKFCWKMQETSRKICNNLFGFPPLEITWKIFLKTFFFFEISWKKFFEDFFLENTCICVLGLERACPRKGCPLPWPRIFFVLGLGLEPCVPHSTSDNH